MKKVADAFLGILWVFFGSLSWQLTAAVADPMEKSNGNNTFEEEEDESDFVYDFEILFGVDSENRLFLGQNRNEVSIGGALTVDLQYGNFFIESGRKNRASAVLGRAYLGYHLWQDERVSLDIISGSYIPGIDKQDKDEDPIPILVNLENRKDDYDFGIRYIYAMDNYFISTDIVKDIFSLSHEGWVVDSYLGSFSSYGNWDFSYGVGHTWVSADVTNYHIGVKPSELSPGLVTYSSGPSYMLNVEASAKTPVSESWIFEAGFSHSWLSDNISDSPLVIDDRVTEIFIGFGYVF